MAFHQQPVSSYFQNLGQKVHQGIELAATAKSKWHTGKLVYSGLQAAAPYIESMLATAALV